MKNLLTVLLVFGLIVVFALNVLYRHANLSYNHTVTSIIFERDNLLLSAPIILLFAYFFVKESFSDDEEKEEKEERK